MNAIIEQYIDSQQAYIDSQQAYIHSQQAYIDSQQAFSFNETSICRSFMCTRASEKSGSEYAQ